MPEENEQPIPAQEKPEDLSHLSPEVREQLTSLREKLMAEAQEPAMMASRSIDEMGFFEGLGKTLEPHLQKKKDILFKDLKASASLALSLVPILGEGKAFLGVVKEGNKITRIEPVSRLLKAGYTVKETFSAVQKSERVIKAVDVSKDALQGLRWYQKIGRLAQKGGEVVARSKVGEVAHVTGKAIKGAVVAGVEGVGSLQADMAADMAKTTEHLMQTNETYKTMHEAKKAGQEVFRQTQDALRYDLPFDAKKVRWFEFGKKWRLRQIDKVAKNEAKLVVETAKKGMEAAKMEGLKGAGLSPFGVKVEVAKEMVKPTIMEGLHFKKFMAFFDKYLNLTPDVPHWVSTTTGVAEFLGAHGADAIPATIQLGINKFRDTKVNFAMGMDVLRYTANRVLNRSNEQRLAAEAFPVAAQGGVA